MKVFISSTFEDLKDYREGELCRAPNSQIPNRKLPKDVGIDDLRKIRDKQNFRAAVKITIKALKPFVKKLPHDILHLTRYTCIIAPKTNKLYMICQKRCLIRSAQ